MPRSLAREGLGRIAALLRTAGETLGRRFGPEASDVLLRGPGRRGAGDRADVWKSSQWTTRRLTALSQTTQRELKLFLERARPPRVRSMRQFAEAEIVIPDGPFAGRRFRCSRQPYTGLWFDAVDSGHWSRYVATGPTQSGKTLSCFVIPLLYHLFEIGETVICGLPDMDMAADKWREDILPAIEQSRYRDLLPTARRRQPWRTRRVDPVRSTARRSSSCPAAAATRAVRGSPPGWS